MALLFPHDPVPADGTEVSSGPRTWYRDNSVGPGLWRLRPYGQDDARSAWDSANRYLYTGKAYSGTSEDAETWTIRRLTISTTGAVTANQRATGAWTGRAGLTYS
jgi:hypothetical protein